VKSPTQAAAVLPRRRQGQQSGGLLTLNKTRLNVGNGRVSVKAELNGSRSPTHQEAPSVEAARVFLSNTVRGTGRQFMATPCGMVDVRASFKNCFVTENGLFKFGHRAVSRCAETLHERDASRTAFG
jgi:hypothetical protein